MTEKCKEEYQRRNYEGLAPLMQEVRKIAKPILGKHGFIEIDILSAWSDIVGKSLAVGITPEKITFDKDKRTNGTLHVKSAGGAFAMLFEHQKNRVIQQINTFFGYPAISNIKIQQGAFKLKSVKSEFARNLSPIQEQDLQKRLSGITDPDLHERLYSLGKAFLLKK